MKKGYVLESINSFVVSVLLMPKRMGHRGYVLIIAINHITFHSIPRLDDKLNESYGSWFLYFNHYILSAAIEASSFINKKSQWQVNRWERTKNQKLFKKKKKVVIQRKMLSFLIFIRITSNRCNNCIKDKNFIRKNKSLQWTLLS